MSQSQEGRSLDGVEIITHPERAKVLVDPMGRQIVRLLARHAMTESELAEALGNHGKILTQSGLIRVPGKEVERHGIVQKFCETKAIAHFFEPRVIPMEIERYFMPVSLEPARGIVAALSMVTGEPGQVSTNDLEQLTKELTSAIVEAAPKYLRRWKGEREKLIIRIYRDALTRLLCKLNMLPEKGSTPIARSQQVICGG
jgi:DNA-binding transcriptional ArsR family regulator